MISLGLFVLTVILSVQAHFNEIWINEKTSIRESFNRTQLEIKANYPEPYYWGAFILVGE